MKLEKKFLDDLFIQIFLIQFINVYSKTYFSTLVHENWRKNEISNESIIFK